MSEESLDLSNTAKDLGVTVGRIARALPQLYAERSEAGDLAFTEISVLSRLLRDGAISPDSLADAEHATPQAVASVLSVLEEQALVKRTHGPADGGKVIMAITHAGRRAREDRARAMTDQLRQVIETDLDPEERAQIQAAVPLLEHIADLL